jgi:hypothetical protein
MKLFKLWKFLAVLFLIILIQSCGQNDEILNIDANYPTTYKKLNATTLIQMQKAFAKDNPYLNSTITDFGFCGSSENDISKPFPSRIPDLTKNEAINAVKLFISQNSTVLGVNKLDEVTLSRIDSFTIYDGSVNWRITSDTQKMDGLEVLYTNLSFSLTNGKMTYCYGNWYPHINIPARITVNEARAKTILLNKVVYLSDIGGSPIPKTITAKSLETAEFSKLIIPIKTADKIELHVAWAVNIPEVFYVIYLDVMTGEIVGGYPTIIS